MSVQIMKGHNEFYKNKLIEKKVQLERSKLMNAERERIQQKLASVQELEREMKQHLESLKTLKTIVTKEDDEFKKRRINYLSDRITEVLATIFPEEQFEAEIVYDFKYGSDKAYLTLKDKNGKTRIPFISEGKLCQYLISFASTVSTVLGLGATEIFIDEAFGVSSSANLPKVGEIIKEYSENGLQFFIISQNSDLYNDIPRREIHFHKDIPSDDARFGEDDVAKIGKVVIDKIVEY